MNGMPEDRSKLRGDLFNLVSLINLIDRRVSSHEDKGTGRACIDCCENTHAVPVCLVELRCRGLSTHTNTSNQRVYKGKAWDSEVGMHPQACC